MRPRAALTENWRYWLRIKRLLEAGVPDATARAVAQTQLLCACGTLASHIRVGPPCVLLCEEHAAHGQPGGRLPPIDRRSLTPRQAETLALLAAGGAIITMRRGHRVADHAGVNQFNLADRSLKRLLAAGYLARHEDTYRSVRHV